jgi:hypothetical protein
VQGGVEQTRVVVSFVVEFRMLYEQWQNAVSYVAIHGERHVGLVAVVLQVIREIKYKRNREQFAKQSIPSIRNHLPASLFPNDPYPVEHSSSAEVGQKSFLQYFIEQLLRLYTVNALEEEYDALLVPWYQTRRHVAFWSFLASRGIQQRES